MTILIIITYSIITVLLILNFIFHLLRGNHTTDKEVAIYLATFICAPIFPILFILFLVYMSILYAFEGLLFLPNKTLKINLYTKHKYTIKVIQQITAELILAGYKKDKLLSGNGADVMHKDNLYITLNTFTINLNYKNKNESIFAYSQHKVQSAIYKMSKV